VARVTDPGLHRRVDVGMDRHLTERLLNDLLIEHHSVFARRHAIRAGVSDDYLNRRVESGALEVVHRGVLRRPGTPVTFRQRIEAARLTVGDGAVAARRTAGALHALASAREVEILTSETRQNRPRGFTVIRTNYLPDEHVVRVHGIPTTSVPRTILDLGGVLPEGVVLRIAKDAIRHGKTSPAVLDEAFRDACRPGRPGSATARLLLTHLDAGEVITESELEDSMFETIRVGGFPPPLRQLQVFDDGIFVARPDGAYWHLLTALEADGYEWHSAKPEWLKDRHRSNFLVSLGWVVLHYTWEDAARPVRFFQALERTIEVRTRLLGT
jgi:hypothetical protein